MGKKFGGVDCWAAIAMIAVTLLLAGCALGYPIEEDDHGNFLAKGAAQSGLDAKNEAINQAAEFCAERQQDMHIDRFHGRQDVDLWKRSIESDDCEELNAPDWSATVCTLYFSCE